MYGRLGVDRPVQAGQMRALSATDFHVLLVLAGGDLYGYAILKAVEEESIGSLYRVLGRLMSGGLVMEVAAPAGEGVMHRGRARRYYRLTDRGRQVLRDDAWRLDRALAIARDRALLPEASKP